MGIRLALGAERRDVMWLVMRESLSLVAVGLALGLGAALALTRLVNSWLFGLTPMDPLTLLLASSVIPGCRRRGSSRPGVTSTRADVLVDYVQGTLRAVRAVPTFVGLRRGLASILEH